ncbi:hypothetical protein HEK616_19690 [Streptomyces nigrescens]|uniref:Uncharacterized protein n=1 Tax=Streptomyces nigrescens TaxID=1920 RepID=A0ABM7ZQ33_STRNI|nr:hypothetical protein HEK616_19690 [Streptomyces nigrescens]
MASHIPRISRRAAPPAGPAAAPSSEPAMPIAALPNTLRVIRLIKSPQLVRFVPSCGLRMPAPEAMTQHRAE